MSLLRVPTSMPCTSRSIFPCRPNHLSRYNMSLLHSWEQGSWNKLITTYWLSYVHPLYARLISLMSSLLFCTFSFAIYPLQTLKVSIHFNNWSVGLSHRVWQDSIYNLGKLARTNLLPSWNLLVTVCIALTLCILCCSSSVMSCSALFLVPHSSKDISISLPITFEVHSFLLKWLTSIVLELLF